MEQKRAPVFLVDDEEVVLTRYKTILEHHGVTDIILFQDAMEVLPQLSSTGCSLILLDLHMPKVSGQEILKQVISQLQKMLISEMMHISMGDLQLEETWI